MKDPSKDFRDFHAEIFRKDFVDSHIVEFSNAPFKPSEGFCPSFGQNPSKSSVTPILRSACGNLTPITPHRILFAKYVISSVKIVLITEGYKRPHIRWAEVEPFNPGFSIFSKKTRFRGKTLNHLIL